MKDELEKMLRCHLIVTGLEDMLIDYLIGETLESHTDYVIKE